MLRFGVYSVPARSTPSFMCRVTSCLIRPGGGTDVALPDAASVISPAQRNAMTQRPKTLIIESTRGFAAGRGVRLGRGRADRPARVPRHDATRGLRLPRGSRAPAVRAAAAGRGAAVLPRDRRLPG